MRYMVDTSAFNRLADGRLSRDQLPADAEFVATHVQIDEINRTSDEERRGQLFLTFAQYAPEILPTETLVWGVSRWGQAKWGAGRFYESIKSALDARNGAHPNNIQDALIAEAALTNGYELVTADTDMAEVVKEHAGNVLYIAL